VASGVVVELGHVVEEVQRRQDVDFDPSGRLAYERARGLDLLGATECGKFYHDV
jgi:hypothetical protein